MISTGLCQRLIHFFWNAALEWADHVVVVFGRGLKAAGGTDARPTNTHATFFGFLGPNTGGLNEQSLQSRTLGCV